MEVKAASRAYHCDAGWSSGAALMKKRWPVAVVSRAANPDVKPVPVTLAPVTGEPRWAVSAPRNEGGSDDHDGRREVRS